MKSWKDCPHLFANGKFKTLSKYENGETSVNDITFYCSRFDDERGETLNDLPINMLTLIARKILDLTDEEHHHWCELRHWSNPLNNYVETGNSQFYLLSIGVYPFDQSHFDTGEVINIKTVEES